MFKKNKREWLNREKIKFKEQIEVIKSEHIIILKKELLIIEQILLYLELKKWWMANY